MCARRLGALDFAASQRADLEHSFVAHRRLVVGLFSSLLPLLWHRPVCLIGCIHALTLRDYKPKSGRVKESKSQKVEKSRVEQDSEKLHSVIPIRRLTERNPLVGLAEADSSGRQKSSALGMTSIW